MSANPLTRWSLEDERQLLKMWNEGLSYEVISKRTGRTIKAIETRLIRMRQHGLTVRKRIGGRRGVKGIWL